MPEMDGYQLAHEVRALEAASGIARTTIIACTANALAGEAEKCFAAGMDDYLAKPVQLAVLGTKLSQWLPLAAAGPIDRAVLAEISNGDPSLEREIIARFHEENVADALALARALAARNSEDVRRCAHRIKGAARTAGANGLAGASATLEEAAGRSDWDAVDQGTEAFRIELARVESYVASLGEALPQ
jgi:CheY-like chemotaxis protein